MSCAALALPTSSWLQNARAPCRPPLDLVSLALTCLLARASWVVPAEPCAPGLAGCGRINSLKICAPLPQSIETTL